MDFNTVYAQKLNSDYKYAVKTVCLSTLLSVLTMPVIIYFFETKLQLSDREKEQTGGRNEDNQLSDYR